MPGFHKPTLDKLIASVETANTNDTKGSSMADLVEYVFGEVPGITCTSRSFTEPDRTDEIDLVFQHSFLLSGLAIPQITLIVECKNEARKISAAHVTRFATKLRDRNLPVGFMISRTGLSGTRSTHAHGAVRTELSHGRTIVILTLEDLRYLVGTDELLTLCEGRRHELEVWRTYTSV